MTTREAIGELFCRYELGLDSAAHVGLIRDAFTTDAVFSMDIAGATAIAPLVGNDTLADAIEGIVAEQTTEQRRHVVSNLYLEDEQPDSVRALAYLTLLITENGEARLQCTGLYTVHAVHQDGTWRFAKMHLSLDGPEGDLDPELAQGNA